LLGNFFELVPIYSCLCRCCLLLPVKWFGFDSEQDRQVIASWTREVDWFANADVWWVARDD
jgi:hypothetical protein